MKSFDAATGEYDRGLKAMEKRQGKTTKVRRCRYCKDDHCFGQCEGAMQALEDMVQT